MKFLVDENISWRVLREIDAVFHGSRHVDGAELGSSPTDERIWRHAADHGFAILTKDRDFNDMALLRGFPPKVVWLQLGNASTTSIAEALLARRADIERFEAADDAAVLVVTLGA